MTNAYRAEADALDREILDVIGRTAPRAFDFNDLALRIFDHQLRFNAPLARYCQTLSVTSSRQLRSWQDIPPVPSGAFKEAALCTFDPARAALIFETSGTTTGSGGLHYMESARLYDASLLAGFHRALLSDAREPLRYMMLLPSPEEKPRSSLSYMMHRVATAFGDRPHSWYVEDGGLQTARFIAGVREARKNGAAVCIAGTAFAFVNLLDGLAQQQVSTLPLPSGSRIMETGGFKGRTRVVERPQLYQKLAGLFELPTERIIGEYGMTEMSSQYYDETFDEPRSKGAPPWLRSYAVDEHGKQLPAGVVGALVHADLANRSSCLAIQTEDLGAVLDDGSLVLIGRERGAELRGCSLDAESLRAAVS